MVVWRYSSVVPMGLALLLSLTGCSGKAIEQAFSADPNTSQWGSAAAKLPSEFPRELRYPEAQLQAVSTEQNQASQGTLQAPLQKTRWGTPDSSAEIQQFYRRLFRGEDWQLVDQKSTRSQTTLTARKQTLQVGVTVETSQAQSEGASPIVVTPGEPLTVFQVDYRKGPTQFKTADQTLATSSPSPEPETEVGPQDNRPALAATSSFVDIEQVPAELRPYVSDLARLEVLTPNATPNDDAGNPSAIFDPNQGITRGTFARWLVESNNRLYRDRPTRQIRLATTAATPAFNDVTASEPLFPYIQGLAEAGYIPSQLTGDSKEAAFKPQQPLTRETLLTWKVPVDLRQILPTTTAAKVQQIWGFKDSSRIAPEALAAVLADHKNGDLANIRRLLGSALLFQPQKAVTRAEAAAALWFIGKEGEGFSAKDVVRAERQTAGQASEQTGQTSE
ncbi:MAG: S-layer homology domain-containing protein [Cyanobacteria bacterium P01_A01_bin.17]